MVIAPTIDEITGQTVMRKMNELVKQTTRFAKEVADLVNTIPTDVQDTYSREAVDAMVEELDSAIDTLSGNVYSKTEADTLLDDKANIIDVYDKSETYNKTETDTLLDDKANVSDVYTKSETDTLLDDKANTSDVYTKSEADNLLSAKANSSDVYAKTDVYNTNEVNNLLSVKANVTDVYTKTETDNKLTLKQDNLTAGSGISISNNVISAIFSGNIVMGDIQATIPTTGYNVYLENVQENDILIMSIDNLNTSIVVPNTSGAGRAILSLQAPSDSSNHYLEQIQIQIIYQASSDKYYLLKQSIKYDSFGPAWTVSSLNVNSVIGKIIRSA